MLDSFTSFWINLQKGSKPFFQHLKSSHEFFSFKKTNQNKRLSCNFHSLTMSAFAAMKVSNQLEQVFNVFDKNGDGKISSTELGLVLLCLGIDDDKVKAGKEAEGIVKVMDFNGDGFIDLDEFMDIMNSSNVGEEDCYLMDAFLIFDAARNGFISAKELQRVLVKLGFDKCSLEKCRRMIKGVDRDGDGFVDFEEFRFMMTGRTS